MAKDFSEIPSEIPNIRTEKPETDSSGDFIITVTDTTDGTLCHKCGRVITEFYGYGREIRLRHLPISGHKSYILIRPKRYECSFCRGGTTTTQRSSWYSAKSPETTAYENHILCESVGSTVTDVSFREKIGYKAIKGITDRRIGYESYRNNIESSDTIGTDEIPIKKGHKDFVTVVTSHVADKTGIVGLIRGREKDSVRKFLSDIPERLRNTIRVVCCDMYEGYINAAEEVSGAGIIIAADRFHVAELYRKGSETPRKQEMKRLKKDLPDEDYRKLKGAMRALRKDESELMPEDREVLRRIFGYSPALKAAYGHCAELTYIFNRKIPENKAEREIGIRAEMVRLLGSECSEDFLSTLKLRIDEITNYFTDRKTGGFVEGMNNKIKVIKRRCYGIFNIRHLFQRIFIDIEGYSLFA